MGAGGWGRGRKTFASAYWRGTTAQPRSMTDTTVFRGMSKPCRSGQPNAVESWMAVLTRSDEQRGHFTRPSSPDGANVTPRASPQGGRG